ncbi:MAG: alanine:cation symporter family protein [Muribaculaceae bacterium]|nr:alanine:cation symporter family protein [Muribaculaceae bacterium]
MEQFLEKLSSFLWGWPMVILLIGTHVYLTVVLRFPQWHLFKAIKLSVTADSGSRGDVSQFGALATALAATIGTGNIIGVATAVALGGPGAVLWCWLTGVFGMATKYSEGLLAIKYRVRQPDGTMLGGPMYALERGLNMKWLAALFAVFTACAALGIGASVQANAISTICRESYAISPVWVGMATALLTAVVVIGGVRSIARVCGALVPFMAAFYVLGCIYLLVLNGHYLWQAVKLIVESAFNPSAAGGGFVGGSVLMAMRYGIARGLFSNESGLGSAPIVAAAAQTRNPVRQALVSSTGTFWDTVLICAITGLVIVSSVLAHPDITFDDGGALTKAAFSHIPIVGTPFLLVGLVTFAFSTILGWCYYGEMAVEYLTGPRWKTLYRIGYVIVVFLGAVLNLAVVWNLADCMNALMAIPNLVSLLLLSGVLVKETRHYLWERRLDEAMTEDSTPGNPAPERLGKVRHIVK